jgi:hypothetical protein
LLVTWGVISFLIHEPQMELHSTFDQFKVFAITILVSGLTIYWHLDGGVPYNVLLKTLFISNMAYSAVKMGVMVAMLMGKIDIISVMNWGFSAMTTGMGEKGLTRLQTSTDIPTPFLMFFAFMAPTLNLKLPKGFIALYTLLSLSTLFFSFSRFLWAVAAVGYVASIFCTSTPRQLLNRCLFGLCIVIGAVSWLGIEATINILWERFLSDETQYSDFQRYVQVDALMDKFLMNPCFGHGLGSYTDECIRNKFQPHSYEVQWIAFLMQFGIFGMIGLVLFACGIAWSYLSPPLTITKLAFMGMYLSWLLSGFTNPFLISLNSGTIYALFYVTGLRLRNASRSSRSPRVSPP